MATDNQQFATGKVDRTAVIEKGAKIGKNVTVEPFAVIRAGVTLEDNVVVRAHAYLDGRTTVGENTVIFPSAVIGTKPQHLRFQGDSSEILIGKNCVIREFVTINASTDPNFAVRVGDRCLIMAYCHIAHNCVIGNRVVMANNATLAGHVTVEDCVTIGGMTPIHQFVRIGCYAMVGGLSRVPYDIPPYTIGAGIPFKFGGLNLIGLKRNGFSLETRSQLSRAFRMLYRSGMKPDEALSMIEKELQPIPEIKHWLEFCRGSRRGLMGLQGVAKANYDEIDMLEDLDLAGAVPI
jgi:UDP-N-acetylglucosamine acyltransferase